LIRIAFVILLCGGLFLQAAVTLEDIRSKPASRARDFLIWEFLQQDGVSKKEAIEAFRLVKDSANIKLKKAYAHIVHDDVFYELACKKRKNLLAITDDKCLRFAFSPYKTIALSRFERDRLVVRDIGEKNRQILLLQNEPYLIKRYLRYPPRFVIAFMLSLPKNEFKKHLNIVFDKEFLNFLSSAPNFDDFIAYAVTDYSLENLHHSLIDFMPKKASAQTYLFLGLNALRANKQKEAVKFFIASKNAALRPIPRDRALFWLYQATGNSNYLQELLLSMSINIYTQYAHEKLHVGFENYYSELSTTNSNTDDNLSDPFVWLKILQMIKATPRPALFGLVSRFRAKNMLPVQRFILECAYNFKMHGYIMPYENLLHSLSNDQKALVYSIMRRESNYIPSAISRSFALGLMQLMPFLVDHLAKKRGDAIKSYHEMFEPEKNIAFAIMHLKWLKKVLHNNPLFIAYAYNGGYGFFKRYRDSRRFGDGRFEPFMSMEMMKNAQTREYGKRVLSNYAMYKYLYKEPFSLIAFFQTLKEPSHHLQVQH